ncbi:unnamed protein product [Pleuronectes platessa]|uniref:Uncharacterized protein n=1 Tax=Pleuronectes platessa TaxID=8262 RepID=A0A9N7U9P6_PLEPL|nr:unnamed protein product [Pleuronectes platessa]
MSSQPPSPPTSSLHSPLPKSLSDLTRGVASNPQFIQSHQPCIGPAAHSLGDRHRSGEGGGSIVRLEDLEGRKPEDREQQQWLPDTKCLSLQAKKRCQTPGVEN